MRLNFEGAESNDLEVHFVYKCAICERKEVILSTGLEICMPLPPAGWQWICASRWNRGWICVDHYDELNGKIQAIKIDVEVQARAKGAD